MIEVDSDQQKANQEGIDTENPDTNSFPTVTIGIPVLNEEEHIERVVSGFLESGYPGLVEILIADGGSKDKTREIVNELSKKDSRVKLVDNPEKYQSFALNRMIEQAHGELFLRADGHCYYDEDYVLKNVEVFQKVNARNVGGAQRYMASNWVQAGISLAVKSFLGNGGAKYMNEKYEGFADTVFLGCFHTEDLRLVGGFNTENITNEDSELNLRLFEKYGESVFISPEIRSRYYARDTYAKLFNQYFKYGRGRFLTRALHPKSTPLRGLIPFFFLFCLFTYLLIDAVIDSNLFSIEISALLAVILIIESFRICVAHRKVFKNEIWQGSDQKRPGFFIMFASTTLSILLMQLGHFSGFLYQLIRSIYKGGKKDW